LAAQAEEAFTAGKPQVAVGLGYGIWAGDDIGDFNPYGIGLWVRGGYTLPSNIYLGGNFDYYFGDSEGDSSFNVYQILFEPGYDIGVAENAVIRPVLGIGYSTYHAESCFGDLCVDASQSKFGLAPGAVFLMDFGSVFGTASARYNHIFLEEDANADAILLGVGVGMAF
jgi:hypothetical protein